MNGDIQSKTEVYWILHEKYLGKDILILWDNYVSLERDLVECVENGCPGSSLSDCLEEICFLEGEIKSRHSEEKEWLIDQMEELKRNCLEHNDFEFFEGINEERKYFEKRFLGEKRDDREIKG